MKKLLVQVSQEDILNGNPGSSCFCPIALAIKRALPSTCRATDVRVRAEAVYFFLDGEAQAVSRLSHRAARFIRIFDLSNEPTEPFRFFVEVPE